MRILVFSDTHLDDHLDKKKYQFLEQIINSADQVIINGDFWEGFLISFDGFINSPWRSLFPLLKSKNAIYIYGNHDKKKYCNEKTNLFSVKQVDNYSFKISDKNYMVEHGHRLLPDIEPLENYQPNKRKVRIYGFIEKMVVRLFEKKVLGLVSRRFNHLIKERIRNELGPDTTLICSHSHYSEIDMKNNFINTGSIKFGFAQYLVIDDGRINLKQEWYG